MRQTVTCDFLGRMGNNMFQVAAMIGYSKKYCLDWGIPTGYRHKEIYKYFPRLPRFRSAGKKLHIHDEGLHGFTYHEIPYVPTGIKLRGFFQSEKYFDDCEDVIKQTFRLNIKPTNRISIHVRRGDYVKYIDNFLPTTVEDVQKVIDHFGRSERFLVCSDDISWCRENLRSLNVHFDFNDGTNEFQDLSEMASCQHHVVSRSSFSWWAAWLGHNPNKTVVTLTPWFGKNNPLDTKDIIPDNWIKL